MTCCIQKTARNKQIVSIKVINDDPEWPLAISSILRCLSYLCMERVNIETSYLMHRLMMTSLSLPMTKHPSVTWRILNFGGPNHTYISGTTETIGSSNFAQRQAIWNIFVTAKARVLKCCDYVNLEITDDSGTASAVVVTWPISQ